MVALRNAVVSALGCGEGEGEICLLWEVVGNSRDLLDDHIETRALRLGV